MALLSHYARNTRCPVWCYGRSGTEMAYPGMWPPACRYCDRVGSRVCGTERAYGAMRSAAAWYPPTRPYALSGTAIAYAAIAARYPPTLSAYAAAPHCPVQAKRMLPH
eukprot:3240858-Rhodomonas_salina.1